MRLCLLYLMAIPATWVVHACACTTATEIMLYIALFLLLATMNAMLAWWVAEQHAWWHLFSQMVVLFGMALAGAEHASRPDVPVQLVLAGVVAMTAAGIAATLVRSQLGYVTARGGAGGCLLPLLIAAVAGICILMDPGCYHQRQAIEYAQLTAAAEEMLQLAAALEKARAGDSAAYPGSLDAVQSRTAPLMLQDPWDNMYQYQTDGTAYTLLSVHDGDWLRWAETLRYTSAQRAIAYSAGDTIRMATPGENPFPAKVGE